MSAYVKQCGRVLIYILPLTLAVLAFAIWPASAPGGTYVNPFWTQNSTSPECGSCSGCGCPKPSEWSPEGVSYRTGELKLDHFLFSTPGVLGSHAFALRWRSMNGGVSQLGRGVLPSWETTANKIILISGNPNGPSGHAVQIRRPIGVIDEFLWDGTAYGPNSCFSSEVSDTLTTNGSGNYVLTDKHGNSLTFDSLGMPATETDRNGNMVTYTYNSSYRLTGLTDDRGMSYTIAHNAGGFISSMTDPAGRTWSFTYDANDNLKTIKTPTTPDQASGITTTLNYDVSDRLTSITDGRGNTVWSFAYVGATSQVSSVTIDGNSVSYSYASGVTSRTDRNGNVNRVYFMGQNITSTDMLVGGVAKYTTLYRYTGTRLSNFVTPRGSRTDYIYDSAGNITERRHRVADTASFTSTDIAHNWTFSSTTNFPLTYTDPEGNVWTYTQDTAGNRTGVTHPNVTSPASQSASESWTYNSYGQVLTHTDEEGLLTTNVYFSSGSSIHLLKDQKVGPTLDPLVESFTYDSAGSLATRTDRNGNIFETSFDNLRRLTETEAPSPLSYRVQYEYDANGNRTQRDVENIDKDGNVVTANPWFTTTWVYTVEDQVSSITEEIDASTTRTTSFDYDANGNRIRVTKPRATRRSGSSMSAISLPSTSVGKATRRHRLPHQCTMRTATS